MEKLNVFLQNNFEMAIYTKKNLAFSVYFELFANLSYYYFFLNQPIDKEGWM